MSQTLRIYYQSCVQKSSNVDENKELITTVQTVYFIRWLDLNWRRYGPNTVESIITKKAEPIFTWWSKLKNLWYLHIRKSFSVPTRNWRDHWKRTRFDRVIAVSKFTLGQAYFFFQNIDYISVKSRSMTDRVGDSVSYYDVLNDYIYSGRHQYHINISHV